jgi:hypothetical protein
MKISFSHWQMNILFLIYNWKCKIFKMNIYIISSPFYYRNENDNIMQKKKSRRRIIIISKKKGTNLYYLFSTKNCIYNSNLNKYGQTASYFLYIFSPYFFIDLFFYIYFILFFFLFSF